MGKLTIWQNGVSREVSFEGTQLLQKVLTEAGFAIDNPCGGRGKCGKCAVKLEGQVSEPNEYEKKAGARLSCQAMLSGDAVVTLPDTRDNRIEVSSDVLETCNPLGEGIGAAIDIGTTTLVLKLYDLATGKELATAARMNPQRSVAADVMGRIGAALQGKAQQLQDQIQDALQQLLTQACAEAGISEDQVSVMVVAGNTTMLYLLTGQNPDCLAHAPFHADTLYGVESRLLGKRVYYPACMNAFVGADITCAVLASGMTDQEGTELLIDIGTNGEIALWKDGKLHVTSTAAGPAFEGAGISCGCGSVSGAIDKVWVEDDEVKFHTIGEAPAVGICGSGLIDAIAAYLQTEDIEITGAMDGKYLPMLNGVNLMPMDVRSVQLAKAAIAAGIVTLLSTAGVEYDEISTLYIAGGFGSHLNVKTAAAIGLIPPALQDRVQVIGNASLTGAASILLNSRQKALGQKLAQESEHINLGGNPKFNENYMEKMFFGDEDDF